MAALSDPIGRSATTGQSSFGLSARALDLLCGVFASQPHINRALIYGSRAKGNYRPGSDIDVVLEAPAMTFTELLRLKTILDDLMLPYQIDLSALHQIDNPALLDHINRVGKPLWVRPD